MSRSAEQKSRVLHLSSLLQVPFEDEEDFIAWSMEHLPSIVCTESSMLGCVCLTIVTRRRPSQRIEIFLIDLVRKRFLSDGIQLCALDFTPFTLETLPDKSFLIAEFQFAAERRTDVNKIQHIAGQIRKELVLYLSASPYSANFLSGGALVYKDEFNYYEGILKL